MRFPEASRRAEAQALVDRAILLEQLDDVHWSEVERCLLRALELDENNIRALSEAALFYDLALGDRAKADKFARQCRNKAAELVDDMNAIIGSATLGDMDSVLWKAAGRS